MLVLGLEITLLKYTWTTWHSVSTRLLAAGEGGALEQGQRSSGRRDVEQEARTREPGTRSNAPVAPRHILGRREALPACISL